MNPIRLGIVGPGLIWENEHKAIITSLQDSFVIAAFCATSEKSRQKINSEFPGIPFFNDYTQLVNADYIDAVVILTPIPLNAQIAIAALNAGRNVFVEKPMALNVSEGEKLIQAEKNTKQRVFILEQAPYSGMWETVNKIIGSGEIGDVLLFEKFSHVKIDTKDDATRGYGKTHWRINPEYSLGLLFDGGIHDIATFSKVFGDPSALFATGVSYRPDFGEYDTVCTVFEYKNGIRGFYSHSGYLTDKRNLFTIRGTGGIISIQESVLRIEKLDESDRTISFTHENAFEKMWKTFIDCLENNEEPYYTTSRGLSDLYLLDAIEKSLKTGEKVFLK